MQCEVCKEDKDTSQFRQYWPWSVCVACLEQSEREQIRVKKHKYFKNGQKFPWQCNLCKGHIGQIWFTSPETATIQTAPNAQEVNVLFSSLGMVCEKCGEFNVAVSGKTAKENSSSPNERWGGRTYAISPNAARSDLYYVEPNVDAKYYLDRTRRKGLSHQAAEVYKCLCQNLSSEQISKKLGITVEYIEKYKGEIEERAKATPPLDS